MAIPILVSDPTKIYTRVHQRRVQNVYSRIIHISPTESFPDIYQQ